MMLAERPVTTKLKNDTFKLRAKIEDPYRTLLQNIIRSLLVKAFLLMPGNEVAMKETENLPQIFYAFCKSIKLLGKSAKQHDDKNNSDISGIMRYYNQEHKAKAKKHYPAAEISLPFYVRVKDNMLKETFNAKDFAKYELNCIRAVAFQSILLTACLFSSHPLLCGL
ncbi:MAG: hypothetical protein QXQ39_02420 [Conexivisphaerales archaeon]